MKLKRTKKSPTITNKNLYKVSSTLYELDFNSLDNESDLSLEIKNKDTGEEFIFTMNLMQDSYCCGLVSIGQFGASYNSGIPNNTIIKYLKEFFIKLHEAAKDSDNQLALVFTLINDEVCNYIYEAIKTELHFTCVKIFNNSNSNCENRVYLNN